jgi:CO/xanthine dehydrogenase Mo-binding subunit
MITRRDLLRSSAVVAVGFSLAPRLRAQNNKPLDPSLVDSFLAIHGDGSVTLYTSKVDVGTGMRIAIPQMAAEELGIPVERISLVEGDTLLVPDSGGTGGSTGLTRGGVEIRQAAATARAALLNLGSQRLGRPATELTIVNTEVRPAAGGAGIAIGTLTGGRALEIKSDPKAPLKNVRDYTVVGRSIPRPDVPGKCTGELTYLQDHTVPGMLHGRVIRPAAIGAKLLSVDEASIRQIPDVKVVRVENFLGVVAKDEWAAIRASRELKVQWGDWKGLPGSANLDQHVRESAIERDQVLTEKGNSAGTLASAPKKVSATYFWPLQSHASMAPSCAIADVKPTGTTVWTSTQATHGLRNTLKKVFNLQGEVRAIFMPGAGSYGGNGNDDAAADAVLLSRAAGQPVRVQWMRQDEHGWDPKGPAQLLDLRASLDGQNVSAWETEMWLPFATPGNRAYPAADAAGIAQDHGQGSGAISQNGDPPFAVPNIKVTTHWVKQSPLRLSNLRAPGKIGNAFAVESFIDELAAAAGMDSIEFRRAKISDPRALAVIASVAEMISWKPRPSPNPQAGVGRGMSYVRYKQAENYVAIAMEVGVDRSTGAVDVRRVVCAHDCGLIVNPEALRNQIEGCITQTISRALHEEVTFDESRVTSTDWVRYPILTFPEAPRVEVSLLNHPEDGITGAGEAATAPVAAALANAIYDACGARLRTAPFTKARLKALLA